MSSTLIPLYYRRKWVGTFVTYKKVSWDIQKCKRETWYKQLFRLCSYTILGPYTFNSKMEIFSFLLNYNCNYKIISSAPKWMCKVTNLVVHLSVVFSQYHITSFIKHPSGFIFSHDSLFKYSSTLFTSHSALLRSELEYMSP